ncbi:MAG TPA: HD-GYP domain-containing protein [Gammaproteobacteria bacterium]|nr:HD-GYP domain-containing protein [Gammaproteobacteria bacterium]
MSTVNQSRVETSELEVGMYVTRLDRPWTETPFLFQGFFIRSADDIEELRRYCQHVFIDVEQSGAVADTGNKADTPRQESPAQGERTITGVTSLRYPSPRQTAGGGHSNRTVYTPALPVEQEMKAARKAHSDATKAVQEILTTLQSGGQLDIELAQQTVEPMVESVLRNPDAMVWLSRMKQHDSYSYHHSVGCSIWGIAFARHLGLDRQALYEIGLGCMLFDVGKTRLPQDLLSKPAALSATEQRVVRNHVDYSVAILENTAGITSRIISMVHSHHERHDGSGYPDGLKGNKIPTFAKIAGMVDCYDALTSIRPYAKQRSPYEAVREIYTWRNNLFQTEVVEQFMQAVGAFPTGSLVELSSGAVGVVIAQNEARRLRPKLMLVLDEHKKKLRHFEMLDLLNDNQWQNVEQLWIEKCLEPGAYGIDPQELYL